MVGEARALTSVVPCHIARDRELIDQLRAIRQVDVGFIEIEFVASKPVVARGVRKREALCWSNVARDIAHKAGVVV